MDLLSIPKLREALEYDLLAVGVDLRGLYTGALSVRRLHACFKQLPATSAVHTALRKRSRESGITVDSAPIEEAPADTLSQSEWLMLALHDQLQMIFWAIAQKGNPKTIPFPTQLPRPGAEPKRKRTMNAWFSLGGITT